MKKREQLQLVVTVGNDGKVDVRIEAENFKGPACKQAIEKLFGDMIRRATDVTSKNKPEYYRTCNRVESKQVQKLLDM